MDVDLSLLGEIADENPHHAERNVQLTGNLGDRLLASAQGVDLPCLGQQRAPQSLVIVPHGNERLQ
jgi:hypothetical protein